MATIHEEALSLTGGAFLTQTRAVDMSDGITMKSEAIQR